MNNSNTALLIIFCAIALTSCNPKFYSPNTQNVPLIGSQGQTNLTLSGNGNQAEFQGAYGVTDKIAVMANFGFFFPPDLDNGNGGSGNFLELGGGYYKALSEKIRFETYGIVGFGSIENHLPSTVSANPGTKGDISAKALRFGFQPNIGYVSRYFTVAASSRFVSLNYNDIQGDLIFDGVNQIGYLRSNKSNFLVEPALTIRGGLENIKLQLQFGYSANLTNSNFRQDNAWGTVGLNFNLNKKVAAE